jgi:hypothetical protein
MNSNQGSARGSRAGDDGPAIWNFLQFLNHEFTPMDTNLLVVAAVYDRRSRAVTAMENVSSRRPMTATWAAAHLRKEFPHFCTGGLGKKVLLKTAPITKEEIRRALVNDVSRE